MAGILDEIVAHKRTQLAALRERSFPTKYTPRPVQLARGHQDELRLIAEVKFRSPSAGPLSTKLSLEHRARAYSEGGASLLSVLCDEKYFDGGYEHLRRAREVCDTPLLCKEFIIDEVQLDAARGFGADAVLLIVRCLSEPELRHLIAGAKSRGLVPVVEIYRQEEAQLALAAGASVIGVNARDLNTLEMDAERAAKILSSLPEDIVKLHLSGVKEPLDVRRIRQGPADGALIGETLMRQDDPSELLAQLIAAATE